MAFQVSPGVQVKEIDQTNTVPAVSASIGAYAGTFNWGPIEQTVLVSSEKELVNSFGRPTTASATAQKSFFTAASFLKYGNALNVVRATSSGALNATTGTSGLLIKNRLSYDAGITATSGASQEFAAKYAGILGNSLKISICASADAWTGWGSSYKDLFSGAPGTSTTAAAVGASNDEMHIVVVDEDGLFSGTAGSVLETFAFVSQAKDARKDDGTSNYYVNVLNETSNYVYWIAHPVILADAGKTLVTSGAAVNFAADSTGSSWDASFAYGVDTAPTSGNVITALGLFSDPENIDISLLFAQTDTGRSTDIASYAISLAEARKDTVAFVSPPTDATVKPTNSALVDVTDWVNGLVNGAVGTGADTAIVSSSYAVIDSTALKVYDKYNDVYLWISAAGHMAGLCAKTDDVADAWFSPAGLSRGQLLGVTKLAFNPNQAQRDTLFKNRINPIVSFPGQGTLLFGDKTALSKASAFDAIGVRRLFITLEKAISRAAKAQLFEFNDDFTRAAFRNATEPFLRTVKGRRGITEFKVICDATNNTSDVIDRNEFVGDIYVKPSRSIRGITLNFIATRTGVSFKELTS